MRNSLLATSCGLTMIHFRREVDDRPPDGGAVLVALGLGYAYVGAALHLFAAARLAAPIGMNRLTAGVHAVAPPTLLTVAVGCFLDRSHPWAEALGASIPNTGLWAPRTPAPPPQPARHWLWG